MSYVNNPIESVFGFLQDFMHVLVICKFYKGPLKTEGTIPVTRPNMGCFDTQGQITLNMNGPIWPNFELFRDFIVVLIILSFIMIR